MLLFDNLSKGYIGVLSTDLEFFSKSEIRLKFKKYFSKMFFSNIYIFRKA